MEAGLFVSQLETLLPLATAWAAEQGEIILREGVPLTGTEMGDARKVGVREPERIRLLRVDTVPAPSHPALQAACRSTNLVPAEPRGLTLYYGIFLRSDCWRDRRLIAHELVHTAQYERFGGIAPFLRQYLLECATIGYAQSPMESEALRLASQLCVA